MIFFRRARWARFSFLALVLCFCFYFLGSWRGVARAVGQRTACLGVLLTCPLELSSLTAQRLLKRVGNAGVSPRMSFGRARAPRQVWIGFAAIQPPFRALMIFNGHRAEFRELMPGGIAELN